MPTPRIDLEREWKLSAWPDFALPDLSGACPGVTTADTIDRILDATYFDAADLRLLRVGVTLRHRTGEGATPGRWTLKVPADPDATGPSMRRHELTRPGAAGAPPAALLRPVRAILRGAEPVAVARLRTRRRVLPVLVDGEPAAEVTDDEVAVLAGDKVCARFRELEVELIAPPVGGVGPSGLSRAVIARLRRAGAAEPQPGTKLARALGPRAYIPSDPIVALAEPTSRVDVAVQAALAGEVRRLLVLLPLLFVAPDVEVVHEARVATRRLRSHLRTFADLLEPSHRESLRTELRWLGGVLGRVRDLDVLVERLVDHTHALTADDAATFGRLVDRLSAGRSPALDALQRALAGARAVTLVDAAVAFAVEPPIVRDGSRPACDVLAALAAEPFRALTKRANRLGPDSSMADLHDLRIRTKRARYAAEVAQPVIPAARTQARALAGLQGVLGDLHDTTITETHLRAAIASGPADEAFVAGLVTAAEQRRAAALRHDWQEHWQRARRRKVRAWLDVSN